MKSSARDLPDQVRHPPSQHSPAPKSLQILLGSLCFWDRRRYPVDLGFLKGFFGQLPVARMPLDAMTPLCSLPLPLNAPRALNIYHTSIILLLSTAGLPDLVCTLPLQALPAMLDPVLPVDRCPVRFKDSQGSPLCHHISVPIFWHRRSPESPDRNGTLSSASPPSQPDSGHSLVSASQPL